MVKGPTPVVTGRGRAVPLRTTRAWPHSSRASRKRVTYSAASRQRHRDHPPRSLARQIIQRRADRRHLIRVRPRGDNLQHGWRTFPPVATGALGFDCSTSPEGYVAFLSHPQLLTIARLMRGARTDVLKVAQ